MPGQIPIHDHRNNIFCHDFRNEHRLIFGFLILQIVLLAVGISNRHLNDVLASYFTFLLAITAIGLTIALFVTLYRTFRHLDKLSELKKIKHRHDTLNLLAIQVQEKETSIKDKNNQLKENLAQEIIKYHQILDNRLFELYLHLNNISQKINSEFTAELLQTQKMFIDKRLLLARILNTSDHGLNPTQREMIRSVGISSAIDVKHENLNRIYWLGEKQKQLLLDWRKNVEYHARKEMPTKLDKKSEERFTKLHSVEKANIQSQKVQETDTIYEAIKQVEKNITKMINENTDDLEVLQERHYELLNHIRRLSARLELSSEVNFRNYFRRCLQILENRSIFVEKGVSITAAAIFLSSIVIHGRLASISGNEIIIAYIPTFTPTPTQTWTSTNTHTPIPTFTFTPNFTLTITTTPTNTLTSTSTRTPKPTLTQTKNKTPTRTLLPTKTKNSLTALGANCIPQWSKTTGLVTEVVDGDTIKVNIDGTIHRLRYIGIDAPETAFTNEYFGLQSYQKNRSLVEGKQVDLYKDVSDVDRYDRLLRYVVVDNMFVNYEMVRTGYAYASTYPPDVACSITFSDAQSIARIGLVGLWAPTAIPTTIKITAPTALQGNCDPSYPTVCIPPPPPDLDCPEIPFDDFKVLQPDPHGFDRDKDGIGCET